MKKAVILLLLLAFTAAAVVTIIFFRKKAISISREKQPLIRDWLITHNRLEYLKNHPEQTKKCEQDACHIFIRNILLYQHLIAASESDLSENELFVCLSETAVNYGDFAHKLRTPVFPNITDEENMTYEMLPAEQRKRLSACTTDELREKIRECSNAICKMIPYTLILEQTGAIVAEETAALRENRFSADSVQKNGKILVECLQKHGIVRKYYEDLSNDNLKYTFNIVYPGDLPYPGLFLQNDGELSLLESGAYIADNV